MTGAQNPGVSDLNSGRFSSEVYNAGVSYALDLLGISAVGAYSVRQLSANYSGKCCNIRRSSDNTTMDIGFVGGIFDVSTFNTFIGSGNGFVAKWYDQSGNGNDASNATAANQPQLVLGSIGAQAGLLFGDASAFALGTSSIATSIMGSGGFWSAAVSMAGNASVADLLFQHSTNFSVRLNATSTKPRVVQATGGLWVTNLSAGTGAHILSGLYSSSATTNVPTLLVDGATKTLGTNTAPSAITAESNAPIFISNGALTGGALGFPGYIGELIIAAAQPTAGNQTLGINSQRNYFSTP